MWARRAPVHIARRLISARQLGTAAAATATAAATNANAKAKAPLPVCGQPLPHTHPHLFPIDFARGTDASAGGGVAHDHITPGIPASEYEARRRALMDSLPSGSVAVLMGGRIKYMSRNIFYRFRQESNFWYLTGLQDPDCMLVLEKNSSARGYRMLLFVPPRDTHNEAWDGPICGIDGATAVFGADEAYANDPAIMLHHLQLILSSSSHIYVDLPSQPTVPRQAVRGTRFSIRDFLAPPTPTGMDLFVRKSDFDTVQRLLGDPRNTRSLVHELDRMRIKKSENELKVMRHAGAISGAAMAETMRYAADGMLESEAQAAFEFGCARRGAERQAYVPVFASGRNALMIHYVRNDAVIPKGSVLSVDAGCEFAGYASDITRTFPTAADGRFSSAQRDLYEALLATLKGCTRLATASQGYSLAQLHRRSVEMLSAELRRLGFSLRSGTLERVLYPHYIGHWLGIDLHDTSTVERSRRLEPGMVITVEPGLYVPDDDAFPAAFRGLGMRVEDDVAVGYDDNIVLSADAPKEVADIEAVCAGRI
ncbi:intermediate cleaving peptidase 55 [Malassezia cuniculi]|uniref:Intermediate cleaving peptidase 55 n=1 Tax=Malassezia cuniculi TaxID=948313 RepID=A0AAF0J6J5_9BASI|nr:intermediate cleaving peptidase 55 [Malassezia cuniculi]